MPSVLGIVIITLPSVLVKRKVAEIHTNVLLPFMKNDITYFEVLDLF